MKKIRIGSFLLALALLLCFTSSIGLAQQENGLWFGGTALWQTVRGMQWTMDKEAVLLLEESRGTPFVLTTQREGFEVWTASENVLGREATWVYHFTNGKLSQAMLQFRLSPEETADADGLIETLRQEMTALYGEPYETGSLSSVSQDDAPGFVSAAKWGEGYATFKPGEPFLDSDVSLLFDLREGEILVALEAVGGVYTY
ncbi:MAG: hypothetical protein IJC54_00430 [Clostridia bacterium]|nr:hypothetical protein [Clostridia bacterium]MBQ4085022.1 hypothetical protein [Clostridia bacterium]